MIHGKCDDVLRLVMQKLQLEIPEWRLKRRFQLERVPTAEGTNLFIRGCDASLNPYSLFTKVIVRSGAKKLAELPKEPYKASIDKSIAKVQIELQFQGHYNEPNYKVEVDMRELEESGNTLTYLMVYNPLIKQWQSCETI